MSGDGTGLVLNCAFEAAADTSMAIAFVQRLGFGRSAFDSSRDATASAEPIDDDRYWVPERSQLIALDGTDLVAVSFAGIPVDLATAEQVMAAALDRRAP